MDVLETVDASTKLPDPLNTKMNEDVAKMRASLLSCSDDISLAAKSIQNVTVRRIYHQVARIVRYLEMMDKLEAKMYEALESTIDNLPTNSTSTLLMLLNIQERLQTNMINSHKLLEPYINIDATLATVQPIADASSALSEYRQSLLPKDSRDKLRIAAQSILIDLQRESVRSETILSEPLEVTDV